MLYPLLMSGRSKDPGAVNKEIADVFHRFLSQVRFRLQHSKSPKPGFVGIRTNPLKLQNCLERFFKIPASRDLRGLRVVGIEVLRDTWP